MSDVRPPTTDASLGELFSQLTTDLSGLVRDEMELAKVELKEDISNVGRAGGMLGGAALAGYLAIVLVSFAAAWGLAELMPVGVAFLIVAALWGIAGYLLYLRGRERVPEDRSQARANDHHPQGGRPMGEESAALKADIEHRRESMTGTIDAIEDKVVPSRIIERRRAAMSGWAANIKERVMGTAHSPTGQASSTAGRVSDTMSHATDAIGDAPAQVQRATAGSPLIAGTVAFGIGALVAALLPETKTEQRAVAAVQPQLADRDRCRERRRPTSARHREVIRAGRRPGPQGLGRRARARRRRPRQGRRSAGQRCSRREQPVVRRPRDSAATSRSRPRRWPCGSGGVATRRPRTLRRVITMISFTHRQ